MLPVFVPDPAKCYRWWSRTAIQLAWGQWRLFDAQYRAGLRMVDTVLDAFGGPRPRTGPPGADLERRAAERMAQGLAPPREIYDVRNRGRIDWTQVPDWARPSDPELFDGAGHEG
jgi:hypothetical protein